MNFPQQLNERTDIDLSDFQTIQNVTLRIALKNVNIATNGKINNDTSPYREAHDNSEMGGDGYFRVHARLEIGNK